MSPIVQLHVQVVPMICDFADSQVRKSAGEPVYLKQDCAPQHRYVKGDVSLWCGDSHGPIWLMDHPASSPDLNPIEACWEHMKESLQAMQALQPGSDAALDMALKRAVTAAWQCIPPEFVFRCITSLPATMTAVHAEPAKLFMCSHRTGELL
jgi:hypothetical protein